MTKHSFVALFFFFTLQKINAQSVDSALACRMVSWLKAEQYDSLTGLAAANVPINRDVFRQIRAAMNYRNTNGIAIDEITETVNNDQHVVCAALADVSRVLTLTFNPGHRLCQICLTPPPYGISYRDAPYADTTLYEEKPILVQTGPFILPGTLTLPKGKQHFPILVFVHGSGSNNRDEALFALKPFRDLSLGLAAKGIATLRYDKRNKVYPGTSCLLPGSLMSIQAETTDDARSAIALAATIPGVENIYVIGHSLGGMMTPQIITDNKILAGAIIMSGPARSFQQTIEDQYRTLKMDENIRAAGLAQLEQIKHLDTLKDSSKMLLNQPAAYWAGLQQYHQLKVIRQVTQPVLFLQGQRDCQVPASDLDLWEKAVRHKKNVTVKRYAKLNHYYGEGKSSMSTSEEYYVPANVPAYVVNDIADWILTAKKF